MKNAIISDEQGSWFYVSSTGARSRAYSSQRAAEAASSADELRYICKEVIRAYVEEPWIADIMLLAGFERLKLEQLGLLLDAISGRWDKERRESVCASIYYSIGGFTPPPLSPRFQALHATFQELLDLDWKDVCDCLEANAVQQLAASRALLRDSAADRQIGGHYAWEWAAAPLSLGPEATTLDSILKRGSPTPELEEASRARRTAPYSSHVLLLRNICSYWLTHLTSDSRRRGEVMSLLLEKGEELHSEIAANLKLIINLAEYVRRCAVDKRMLKKKLVPADVAYSFFRFNVLCFSSWQSLHEVYDRKAPRVDERSVERPKHSAAGVVILNHARGAPARRAPCQVAPLDAYILRAQGSTRSPRGHRA